MKLLVAGDYCPRGKVAQIVEDSNYAELFSDIKKLTANVDYSIVNLECPVVVGKPERPIEKNGPNLICTPNAVEAIRWAGFDCVTLANNHIFDYGEQGIADTISILKKNCVDYVGGGSDFSEASSVLYKEIRGKYLAVINCCEHEFSIASEDSAGANPLNPVQQYYSILEAKRKADKVLVIVHGGHEHFQLPSPRMVETYRFFIDAGADAVINHHQHCYSGYEVYKGKPIFYGLGNFCFESFGKASKKWTEGYAVSIDFEGEFPTFELHPYIQCDKGPNVILLAKNAFDSSIKKLNCIIETPKSLQKEVDDYFSRSTEGYSNVLEPLYNKVYLSAKHRKWLPSFISKKRIRTAYNYIACEAHRDKFIWWLHNNK